MKSISTPMIPKQFQSLNYFEFPNLKPFPEIVHAVFTRDKGFSKPPFHSLNITYNIGDSEISVRRNRQLISECMENMEPVFADQIHGIHVIVYSKEKPNLFSDTNQKGDALITNIPGKGLVIQTADCQSVMLYDPIRQVIGNIHSGWKGSIGNIIGSTIHAMGEHFGTKPEHLIAGIGPSMGPCCAEFIHFRKEIPEKFHAYKNDRHFFDFWEISRNQLADAGVSDKNICVSGLCTKCRTDLFYSYRKEKSTGRFGSVIGLKKR